MSIPVGGPFERVGVDIMELPQTKLGHRYVVVFEDYLTKWVEVYPVKDQTSETIARLLVDNVICRHGIPMELLSDRGANLLSDLILDVCKLVGMKKINTTAYHPRTDGLVENFNRTLQRMMAKHAHTFGCDWDVHLQQLLFAYCTKPHDSNGEFPFYLLYGRDARVPTETALSQPRTPYQVDVEDYRLELTTGLAAGWEAARQEVQKSQARQKKHFDKKAKEPRHSVGGRVMVFMPHEAQGRKRKLALPYHGPYRILEVRENCLLVHPVDRPELTPILVSMDRVTTCPSALPDTSWLGEKPKRQKRRKRPTEPAGEATTPPRYELRSQKSGD